LYVKCFTLLNGRQKGYSYRMKGSAIAEGPHNAHVDMSWNLVNYCTTVLLQRLNVRLSRTTPNLDNKNDSRVNDCWAAESDIHVSITQHCSTTNQTMFALFKVPFLQNGSRSYSQCDCIVYYVMHNDAGIEEIACTHSSIEENSSVFNLIRMR